MGCTALPKECCNISIEGIFLIALFFFHSSLSPRMVISFSKWMLEKGARFHFSADDRRKTKKCSPVSQHQHYTKAQAPLHKLIGFFESFLLIWAINAPFVVMSVHCKSVSTHSRQRDMVPHSEDPHSSTETQSVTLQKEVCSRTCRL